MSRYEKINYDELEMLAANGGIDQNAAKHTLFEWCKKLSKWITEKLDCHKSFNVIVPIAPPEELHPWEP